jgi:hypothetical protein
MFFPPTYLFVKEDKKSYEKNHYFFDFGSNFGEIAWTLNPTFPEQTKKARKLLPAGH